MALNPKSAVFQVRIDPALLVRFQVVCELQHCTVSDAIRRMILYRVSEFDRAEERRRNAANRT